MFTNNLTIINGMYQSLLDHCLYVIFLYCCVIFFQFCYQCNNTVIKQLVFDVVFLFMFVFPPNTNLLLAFIISLLCKFLNNEKEIITHINTPAHTDHLNNWKLFFFHYSTIFFQTQPLLMLTRFFSFLYSQPTEIHNSK